MTADLDLLPMFVQYLNKMTDADSAIPITLTVSGLVVTDELVPAWR
jgi:hypothetical protein